MMVGNVALLNKISNEFYHWKPNIISLINRIILIIYTFFKNYLNKREGGGGRSTRRSILFLNGSSG